MAEAGNRLARAGHLPRSSTRRWRSITPRARVNRHRSRSHLPTPTEAMLPWGVVLVGVGFMVGLMVAVFMVPIGQPAGPAPSGHDVAYPPPTSTPTANDPEEGSGKDEYTIRDVAGVRYSPTPAPESPPAPAPSESPEPSEPPPDPHLAAKYKVEERHWDVFIANVVIVNQSSADRDWRVELAFGSDVGKLNTFWVDGTPQPTLDRSGERYRFTSTVPVPARSWVVLKVHFDRQGRDIYPNTCTVNGADCSIVR